MTETRRAVLALFVPAAVVAACRRPPPGVAGGSSPAIPGPRATVELVAIPDGGRTVVRLGTAPVEVRRTGRTVTAKSLLCTHMGCVVQWREAEAAYYCPCHQGRYDATGRAIEGPPPRGLDPVPAFVEGDIVVLGGTAAGR